MSKVTVGIPARMGASRFPGKPLAEILGMPMIQHVYLRSIRAKTVDRVFIATCDEVIRATCEAFGAEVVMTDPDIERPGLRVAAACEELRIPDRDIVVVVQGDEPLVRPEMIDQAVLALQDSNYQMGTLVGAASPEEWNDPNEVKVVSSISNQILYMSRSAIPSNERGNVLIAMKQVAIMPFRMSMLRQFQSLPMTPLEIVESVELVRALEHGIAVLAIPTKFRNVSVDDTHGLREAEIMMSSDKLYLEYRL